MNFDCLASSSSGNCYYIELERKDREPVRLLVEAGIKYREIVKKMAMQKHDLNAVDAVLITHGHNDHSTARNDLIKHGMTIYANEYLASSEGAILRHGESKYIAAQTKVTSFSVEHDAPDPLGYVIQTDLETIMFATDLKFFKADLSEINFDYIFIEANYDGQVVHFARQHAKETGNRGEIARYERILNNHMSISNAIKTLQMLDLSRCKAIILMHLSDRHANEFAFKSKVKDATKTTCLVCKKNGGFI